MGYSPRGRKESDTTERFHFHFISSLEKCLFRSSSIFFFISLLVFLILTCMSFLYTLEINLSSDSSFAIIFSHSEDCVFTLFIVFFAVQKIFKFN